jgi:hypothetical protein
VGHDQADGDADGLGDAWDETDGENNGEIGDDPTVEVSAPRSGCQMAAGAQATAGPLPWLLAFFGLRRPRP